MPKRRPFHKGHNLPRESYPDIPYMLRQQATKSPVKKQTSQFDQRRAIGMAMSAVRIRCPMSYAFFVRPPKRRSRFDS